MEYSSDHSVLSVGVLHKRRTTITPQILLNLRCGSLAQRLCLNCSCTDEKGH